MHTELITGPDESITLGEAKLHLRIDDDIDEDDDLIESLIIAARQRAETELKRALGEQNWYMYLDCWPCGRVIDIPRPPLISVDSVQYYDADGDLTTLDDDDYTVSTGTPGRLVLNDTATWPTLQSRPDAVVISFLTGYVAADMPACVKQAMLLMVGHWYKNREQVVDRATSELPFAVSALLDPERWGSYE